MAIPAFDSHGLLPPGVWDCTFSDIASSLCWNDHRRDILNGLARFLSSEWKPLSIACPLFIDGSFVRNKPLPDDVDIVLDLTNVTAYQPLALALALRIRRDEIKEAYNVDVWARHPNLSHDLFAFFQYIGDKAAAELHLDSKHPKGILRIQP